MKFKKRLRPSGVHFRFILNYDKEVKGNREVLVYPLFEHFKMLRHLRERNQEKIYDIDRFELTYFPDMMAFYKLDLRKKKRPGFFLVEPADWPTILHSVNLGATMQGSLITFSIMFHWDGRTPLLTGFLERKAKRSNTPDYQKVFDFPLELLFPESIFSQVFRRRKRLLKRYHLSLSEKVFGPYTKPLEPKIEWEVVQYKYYNRFVTFLQEEAE